MNDVFVVEQHQLALEYDQMPKRPITERVRSPQEINDAFYDRTPEKAAAFLRMLKYATNDTIFQQSLARYLKQNKCVFTMSILNNFIDIRELNNIMTNNIIITYYVMYER